jgi:hypothetical protein
MNMDNFKSYSRSLTFDDFEATLDLVRSDESVVAYSSEIFVFSLLGFGPPFSSKMGVRVFDLEKAAGKISDPVFSRLIGDMEVLFSFQVKFMMDLLRRGEVFFRDSDWEEGVLPLPIGESARDLGSNCKIPLLVGRNS